MVCQKQHRRVNPRFAECLLNMQARHAIETAENEGWPAELMQAVVKANASGAVHLVLRWFHRTAAQA